ncbi:MAG: hypothetical protein KL801_00190 [Mesorhizobium sp.]|nr:hypothetical protein [Mesorhizobium sp.]
MDWNAAIEHHRAALTRILAMLVAMAGLRNGQPEIAGRQSGPAQAADGPADCPLPIADRPTLPRHLHRAVLRLLRPAEAAVRRLVIVVARGLVTEARRHLYEPTHSTDEGPGAYRPPLRFASQTTSPPLDGVEEERRAAQPGFPLPRRAGERCRAKRRGVGVENSPASHCRPARRLTLSLFDPLPRWRARRPVAGGVPRISVPGIAAPFPVPAPPSPLDPLDATRLALRLAALARTLDDLPVAARRFALWQARIAAPDQSGNRSDAAGRQAKGPTRARRIWPLRPGRPHGQRPARSREPAHPVHTVLDDVHGLALWVLEPADTS